MTSTSPDGNRFVEHAIAGDFAGLGNTAAFAELPGVPEIETAPVIRCPAVLG